MPPIAILILSTCLLGLFVLVLGGIMHNAGAADAEIEGLQEDDKE